MISDLILIDPELWAKTRSGARAGRGFRYQDALCAALAVEAWAGEAAWNAVVPEGLEDATLHGPGLEIRAQIKSRHDPRGRFSLSEVADFVVKMMVPLDGVTDGSVRLALILERTVDGLEASGWLEPLASTGQKFEAFAQALTTAFAPRTIDTVALLARLHLVVSPDPLSAVPLVLERKGSLDPAAGRLVAQELRTAAGRAADDNYANQPQAPASLGATDVQRLIDGVQRILDPLGRLKLADGLCEAANFQESLNTSDFYSGVNVMPGHVGAGLVFDRPAETADILEGLEAHRAALVAGPSGAGKSALTWLAAYHTRHAVRWYRVRRLGEADVPRLVQLARLLDAGPGRPVGFVIDDVGRTGAAGWDMLASETQAIAGLLILGSVREEDIFLLGTAATTPVVRPHLDEPLAERLWLALSAQGEVAFSHWVEPFDESKGLLLEYTHLLAKGQRLEQTLTEQVRRRLSENRNDELELLRRIAFPSRYGAVVESRFIRERLGWDGFRMAKALARLIEEHAVKETPDGGLAGLHEIRSAYLDNAIRACLDMPLSEMIIEAASIVSATHLPIFIVRVLRAHPEERSELVGALARRTVGGDVASLGPILHGLGLATADIVAAHWLEISRRLKVDDRISSLLFNLTAAAPMEGDLPLFAKVREAGASFATVEVEDLRGSFLDRLEDVSGLYIHHIDLETLHRLQAALMPLRGCSKAPSLDLPLDQDLSAAPLLPLLEFIRTTWDIKATESARLVDLAGGSLALLARLRDEIPWITAPRLVEVEGEDGGGREAAVEANVRVISDAVQTDLHGDVVRLCELMLVAAPEARRALSDTILPDGSSLKVAGQSLNSKRIPRESLPSPARVAWNRAQARAVDRLVGAPQETGRTASLANLIEELSRRLDEAANLYLRMEKPKERWKLLINIAGMLRDFVPPPRVNEVMSHSLDPGSYSGSDHMHNFAADLQTLVLELADGNDENVKVRAMRVVDLIETAEKLSDPALWRMISSPPIQAMSDLSTRLRDIRAVYGHIANDPDRRRRWAAHFSTTSRRHSALAKAASQSRIQADADLATSRKKYEEVFANAGLTVRVHARAPEKDAGYAWPHVYFAGLVVTDSIGAWMTDLDRFNAVCETLTDEPRMSCAPLIRDQIPPIAMVRIGKVLLPDLNFAGEWAAHLPWPIVDTPLLNRVTGTLADISAVSAMIQDKGTDLNPAEAIHFEAYLHRIENAIAWFGEATADETSVALAMASQVILTGIQRMQAELQGSAKRGSLAVEFGRLMNGELSELTAQVTTLRIALMEHALGLEAWSDLSVPLEGVDT